MQKTKWNLDRAHSEIQFKVKHMMISTVTGHFSEFDAQVETEGDDFTTAKVTFTADLSSISTHNEQRDTHLRSADFFDAEHHPQIKFTSSKLRHADGAHYILEGDLTIRGTTRPVKFNVEYGGTVKDPWGLTRAGFTIEGKINRKEYGLHWNALTETGGLVVSDEVRILANAEFTKAAATENEAPAPEPAKAA